MSVIRITAIQFDSRAIRENTVLTVIAHPIEIKIYLLIYLLTHYNFLKGSYKDWKLMDYFIFCKFRNKDKRIKD